MCVKFLVGTRSFTLYVLVQFYGKSEFCENGGFSLSGSHIAEWMPRFHQWNLMTSRNDWNALMRNGGSIYDIYSLLGGYLLFIIAFNGSAISHLYTFSFLWSEVWKWYILHITNRIIHIPLVNTLLRLAPSCFIICLVLVWCLYFILELKFP